MWLLGRCLEERKRIVTKENVPEVNIHGVQCLSKRIMTQKGLLSWPLEEEAGLPNLFGPIYLANAWACRPCTAWQHRYYAILLRRSRQNYHSIRSCSFSRMQALLNTVTDQNLGYLLGPAAKAFLEHNSLYKWLQWGWVYHDAWKTCLAHQQLRDISCMSRGRNKGDSCYRAFWQL